MQYALQVFEYEDQREFRTLEIDGEIWFFAIDVANALDIKNPSDAYARLDPDDLGQTEGVDKRGQKQVFRIINEPGLYTLILRSDKPEAVRFKRWVTHDVLPQIRRTGAYIPRQGRATPRFIRRFNANWDRIDNGYFSVISELAIRLWGRLEQIGYIMADVAADGTELRPDISVGKRFAKYLEENHPHLADEYAFYLHWTAAGEFPSRQYTLKVLPTYLTYLDQIWIPKHAEEYFKTRDPAALPHLPKLLPPKGKPRAGMMTKPTRPQPRRK